MATLLDHLQPNAVPLIIERAKLLARAADDVELQAAIRKMCRFGTPEGMPGWQFWLHNFGFVFEPRNDAEFQKLPFIPYEFQIDEFEVLHKALQEGRGVNGERSNIVYSKSRGVGITWVVITYFFWDWLFNNASYLVGHRKEDMVDKIGDMGTHFEKFRWLLRCQPPYLYPPGFDWRVHSKEKLLQNPQGGALSGDSANAEFGRGDRRSGILYDEFPTWEHDMESWKGGAGTTNVRIAIGTPKGMHNYYARLVHKKGEDIEDRVLRTIHWTKHPEFTKDLEYDSLGKPTSSWYRRQTANLSPHDVASELDLNFQKSLKGGVFQKLYTIGHRVSGLQPLRTEAVITSLDPGRTFYVLFLQFSPWGQVRALKEFLTVEARTKEVGEKIASILNDPRGFFYNLEREYFGDPAGAVKYAAAQEYADYEILKDKPFNMNVDYSFVQSIPNALKRDYKIKAIEQKLTTFVSAGDGTAGPGLLVDVDGCPILDDALSGGYRYKLDPRTKEITDDVEQIHPYEDAIDALAYAILSKCGLTGFVAPRDKTADEPDEDDEDNDSLKWKTGLYRC